MTPDDLVLDRSMFLTGRPIPLYRIAKTRYANLAGIGAAASPGRWNLPGQEAIYTSSEIGTCVLEILAHIPKTQVPTNLSTMHLRIFGEWQLDEVSRFSSFLFDNRTGAAWYLCETLATAKDLFKEKLFSQRRVFAAAIPSVVAPAWNVVLFPLANGFDEHVALERIEPFQFDSRLFADPQPLQPAE